MKELSWVHGGIGRRKEATILKVINNKGLIGTDAKRRMLEATKKLKLFNRMKNSEYEPVHL